MLEKPDITRQLLSGGDIRIFLDPRREGVRVPPWFTHQPELILDISPSIPNVLGVQVLPTHLEAICYFAKTPFTVVVPWSALYAIHSLSGGPLVFWGRHAPAEPLPAPSPAVRAVLDTRQPTPPRRSELRLVRGRTRKPRPAWFRGVVDGGRGRGPEAC